MLLSIRRKLLKCYVNTQNISHLTSNSSLSKREIFLTDFLFRFPFFMFSSDKASDTQEDSGWLCLWFLRTVDFFFMVLSYSHKSTQNSPESSTSSLSLFRHICHKHTFFHHLQVGLLSECFRLRTIF